MTTPTTNVPMQHEHHLATALLIQASQVLVSGGAPKESVAHLIADLRAWIEREAAREAKK